MIVSETFNAPLARTVRDFLANHPQRHDQDRWMMGRVEVLARDPELGRDIPALIAALEAAWRDDTCATVGCLAGWASLFAGYRQVSDGELVYDPATLPAGSTDPWDARDKLGMRDAAQYALGLTYEQAEALFWHANTLDDIDDMLDRIIDDPTDTLTDVIDEHVTYDEDRR